MARTVRSTPLETRSARLRLKPRRKPYRQASAKAGLHLGYRRIADKNGSWVAFTYQGSSGSYSERAFAQADDYSDVDGSEVIGYFEAMRRIAGAAPPVRHGSQYRIADAVEAYVASLKLNATTGQEAERVLKHYLIGFLSRDGTDGSDRVLADLTSDHFAKWSAWALANPAQKRGKKRQQAEKFAGDEAAEALRKRKERVNRVLNTVLACLNFAYENDKVASDTAWSKLKRFKGTDQARIRWLDLDECRRITNACAADFRRLVLGGLLTGARWSELRRLRVRDYDSSAGTVLIARAKRKKARHIYLTQEGKQAFDEWTAGLDRNGRMFTREGGEPWSSQDQRRPMLEACAAAQLGTDVTFHVLRHTYASMLVKAGVHLMIVAQSLGHADTRMVEKHYGHLAPSHAAETIRASLPIFGIQLSGNVEEPAITKDPL